MRAENPMIHVIATIEIVPWKQDDFLAAFQEVVPDVRAEAGCLEYGPTIDVATPVSEPVRVDVVTVVEKWASVEALTKHLEAPHMLRYKRAVKDIVKGVTIRV